MYYNGSTTRLHGGGYKVELRFSIGDKSQRVGYFYGTSLQHAINNRETCLRALKGEAICDKHSTQETWTLMVWLMLATMFGIIAYYAADAIWGPL